MEQFSPIRFYDAPEVVASQIIDGHFSLGSGLQAFKEGLGGTPSLPFHQRQSLSDRIDTGNPLTQALVNVATNPFTALYFLAGVPAGKIAGGLFSVAPKYSAAVMKHAPFLHTIGVATGRQLTRGTPLYAFANQARTGLEDWRGALKSVTDDSLETFLKRHKNLGVDPRDFTRIDDLTGAKRELLEEVNDLIYVRLRGLNRTRNELFIESSKEAGFTVGTKNVRRLINVSDEAIDARLAELGAKGMLDSMRNTRRKAFELLFLDAAGNVDASKVARIHSSRSFNYGNEAMSHAARGDKAIAQMFGPEVLKHVQSGTLDRKGFLKLVEDVHGQVLKGNEEFYLPRNAFRTLDGAGREVPKARFLRDYDTNDSVLEVARNVKGRQTEFALDQEDLARLKQRFAGNIDEAAFETQEKFARKMIHEARDRHQGIAFLERMRPFEQLDRYYNTAGHTYAMYAQPLSARTLSAQTRSLSKLRGSKHADEIRNRNELLRDSQGKIDGKGANVLDDFATAAEQPLGGFTVADGIDQSYRLIPKANKPARKYIREMLVPALSGRATPRDGAATAIKIFAQENLEAFMATPIGDALRKSQTKEVQSFVRGIDKIIDSDFVDNGGNWSGNISRWFYVTHLGANMGSVLKNLTQPLVTTGRWVQADDLAKGYARATEDMAKYVAARTKLGLNPTAEALENLQAKHFRLFDEMGLAKNSAFEMLDSSLQRAGMFSGTSKAGAWNQTQNGLMSLFQNAEVYNRLVTAEAFAAKAKRLGRSLDDFEVLDEIAQGVAESQFGADVMNTPSIMMSEKSPLANPLLKMFLQFPTRMATSVFEVGSVAGDNLNPLMGIARDFARGVGITAIGYETLKAFDRDTSLFGKVLPPSDIVSQVGFVESTGQIFSNFIDDQDGPIPIPPVIDIAAETAKFLTGQDNEFFKYTLPRLVPGGIQLARMAQALPDLSGGNPTLSEINPQRRFARWDQQDENGFVPVFRSDGTLINNVHGTSLLMRALGLDLTGFQSEAQLEQFLMEQGRISGTMKQELGRRLFAGDHKGARQLQQQFQERFGYELKLTKSDIRRMQSMRSTPRVERILDKTPEGARERYTQMVLDDRQLDSLNFTGTQQQFIDAGTSRGRETLRKFQQRIDPDQLPPEFFQ